MDSIVFTLLIFGALILLLLVIVGTSYFIYRFIKKGNFDKRLRTLALIPFIIFGYFVYDAFYPSDSFYKQDFSEVTGLKFPENGNIKYKTATFPDHFGDYTSIMVVDIDTTSFNQLPGHLISRGFSEDSLQMDSDEFKDIEERLGRLDVERRFSFEEGGGVYYYVGFMADKHSLIIQRTSW